MNDDMNSNTNDDNESGQHEREQHERELSEHELNEHDLVARLRDADPAADLEPSAGFAENVVARTLAEPVAETAEPAVQSAPVADLNSERVRRRPRWLPYVAVAASLALVGGAGFGIGAATGRPSITADGAALPISLQSGAGTNESSSQDGAVQSGAVQPGMVQNGFDNASGSRSKMSSDSISPSWFGRNNFSASGLSTDAGTASTYTFDAHTASNAETITALAAALGVEGTAELKDGSWMVGPQDGTAPSLSVSLDGTLSFYFADNRINPWQCGDGTVACEPPATLPSEDAAIDALRSLITSAGGDPGAFEFTSETWDGAFTRTAQAWPVVDGKRLDQSWSVELTDAGVVSANGALASIVPLGDYPIVSEQDGFKRLSDPRFGAQMTAMPLAMRAQTDGGPAASTDWVPPTEPPTTPAAGTSLSWPVNMVDIVSARLGLASQWQPDGGVLVVPAYEFTDAEGGTWSVIAVDDSKLDFGTE
ncbi:hypothetical protein GCM10022381_15010 [Leifsonia kafniensis]|uniref:Uncharacterized protein n=1 Tax=Leifsonia kafniensis TaxID=475957 RepID=A0ABP7KCG5_9MICO